MSGPADRRRTERFPVNATAACTFLSPVVENFGPVKIKNISTDGIGLVVMRRVEPGTLLTLTLANALAQFQQDVPGPGGSRDGRARLLRGRRHLQHALDL